MSVLGTVVKEFPVYNQEMDRAGVVWLFQQPLGEYYLSGPNAECTSVAALKGKKIRSFGADIPKAFSAIGAVPVTVAPTDIYEALQHGTLDYSFINPGNIQSFRLVEVGKNHCGPVMAITGHNVTMSKRTWARLPKDIQQAFRDQSAKTAEDYLTWVGEFEAKAVANIKSQGGTFVPFPAAELKKWRSTAPDFLAQWEKDTAAATKDAETPKKVAARWRQLLAK
jgi:TRAP-type C4-dicarboxylate transport system substrate-binding protein